MKTEDADIRIGGFRKFEDVRKEKDDDQDVKDRHVVHG